MRPKNDSATSSRRGNDGLRFQPPAGLEDVVDSIDVLEPGFRGRWILPNGAYDLVLGVRADDAESPSELPRFVLHTRLTRPFRIPDHQGMSCTAVRFRPGGLRAFWTGKLAELERDDRAALRVFRGVEAMDRQVRRSGDPAGKAARVGRWLASLRREAARGRPTEREDVWEVVEELWGGEPPGRPGDVRRSLGISERTFERLMRKWIGTSYQSLVRVARVNLAFKLRMEDDLPWAVAAADVGFADQPDLVRSTRRVYGGSPGAALAEVLSGTFHRRWTLAVDAGVVRSPEQGAGGVGIAQYAATCK